MARDVKAIPVEASLPAAGFEGEFFLENIHSFSFIARTSHVLDVDESRGANVPNGRCNHQSTSPAAKEGHTSAEERVKEEEEGCEQQQGPTPGQFDEVPAGDQKRAPRKRSSFISVLTTGLVYLSLRNWMLYMIH